MKKVIFIFLAGSLVVTSDYLHTSAGAGAGRGHYDERSYELGQELLQLMKNYRASGSHDVVNLEGDIRQLIAAGADLSVRNEEDDTALTLAEKIEYSEEIVQTIQAAKHAFGAQLMREIRGEGDLTRIGQLINQGADVNVQTPEGNTILMWAAQNGHANIVQILLNRGADVNHQNTSGSTALMSAAQRGHAEIVQMLLDRGANPMITNKKDTTALDLYPAARQDIREMLAVAEENYDNLSNFVLK